MGFALRTALVVTAWERFEKTEFVRVDVVALRLMRGFLGSGCDSCPDYPDPSPRVARDLEIKISQFNLCVIFRSNLSWLWDWSRLGDKDPGPGTRTGPVPVKEQTPCGATGL
ncbi:hypothetical protein KH5H1_08930 [Corallococcus caeni]|nr:hypothetical protein KH5H1_08930 [Corallococcus sp. KH5-1]